MCGEVISRSARGESPRRSQAHCLKGSLRQVKVLLQQRRNGVLVFRLNGHGILNGISQVPDGEMGDLREVVDLLACEVGQAQRIRLAGSAHFECVGQTCGAQKSATRHQTTRRQTGRTSFWCSEQKARRVPAWWQAEQNDSASLPQTPQDGAFEADAAISFRKVAGRSERGRGRFAESPTRRERRGPSPALLVERQRASRVDSDAAKCDNERLMPLHSGPTRFRRTCRGRLGAQSIRCGVDQIRGLALPRPTARSLARQSPIKLSRRGARLWRKPSQAGRAAGKVPPLRLCLVSLARTPWAGSRLRPRTTLQQTLAHRTDPREPSAGRAGTPTLPASTATASRCQARRTASALRRTQSTGRSALAAGCVPSLTRARFVVSRHQLVPSPGVGVRGRGWRSPSEGRPPAPARHSGQFLRHP